MGERKEAFRKLGLMKRQAESSPPNFSRVYEVFPNQESCKQFLYEFQKGRKIVCPLCGGEKHFWDKYNQCWKCANCRKYNTSLTINTFLHHTRQSLLIWFKAILWIGLEENAPLLLDFQKGLQLKRYQSTWDLYHKVLHAKKSKDPLFEAILKQLICKDESSFKNMESLSS
ncbi:MAG TPA: hypothetical protein DDY68_02710 [Porphyromonadaceae bacterium]|nr:hypothetical protein [Porphyromonadaceae bacterium]